MFKFVRHITKDREVRGADNHCLLVCHDDVRLLLLSANKARDHVLSILPIGGAVVTIASPESETLITDGKQKMPSVEISEQDIVTVLSDGTQWCLAGKTRKETRNRKPPKEAALT